MGLRTCSEPFRSTTPLRERAEQRRTVQLRGVERAERSGSQLNFTESLKPSSPPRLPHFPPPQPTGSIQSERIPGSSPDHGTLALRRRRRSSPATTATSPSPRPPRHPRPNSHPCNLAISSPPSSSKAAFCSAITLGAYGLCGPLAAEITRASSSSPAARIRRLQGRHPRLRHIQQGEIHIPSSPLFLYCS